MFTVLLSSATCKENPLEYNASLVDEDFQNSMAQLRHIAYKILGPTLIAIGILGNILNLIVLARPFLHECTLFYLRFLAIADLNVLIFEIPMMVRLNELQRGTLQLAIYHAHFELVLITTFLAFNIYIVICLTVDRYISVCVPVMFNTIHTKKKAKISIVVCFAVAVIVSLPLFMLKIVCYTNNEWKIQENTLVTDTLYWQMYIIISEILIRIGPAIVLAVLNILIIHKFRIIRQKRKNFLIPSQLNYKNSAISSATVVSCLRNKKYQEEKRLVVLLQAVVILFFLTMIPSSCLSFLYSDSEEVKLHYQIFRAVANLLEITNSALNFCAYFLCSKEFRAGLLSIFTGCCKPPAQDNIRKGLNCNVDGLKAVSDIQTISNESINRISIYNRN